MMKTLIIDKDPNIALSKFDKPKQCDVTRMIEVHDSGLILRNSKGVLIAAVVVLRSEEVEQLRSLLLSVKFRLSERTDGLWSNSRTFGSLPRNTIRRDYCSEAALAYDHPEVDARLKQFSVTVSDQFRLADQLAYTHQNTSLQKSVHSDWIISGSVYTSGIVNYNNGLGYHKDSQNFNDFYSGMLTLKSSVIGGELSLPEYGIAIDLPDSSLLFFQGQNVLHGVMPFKLKNRLSYRVTAVFYAMQPLCKCQSKQEELKRIQKLKTERSQNRARGLAILSSLDLTQKPQYPIFIPSKGRAQYASAASAINGSSTIVPAIPFTMVVEPQEEKSYRLNHPLADILVLPKSDQGITYVRQFILEYARSKGFLKYWQIDDNISGWMVKLNGILQQVNPLYVLAQIEKATKDNPNIALAGTDYQQFAALNTQKHSFNTRVYCCALTRTDTGIDYRPETEMKEDVDFCLQHLSKGYKTMLFHEYAMKKPAMGKTKKGGLTDKYKAGLDLLAAERLCRMWPSIATLTQKGSRVDAKINWQLAAKP
jgi:hypothetical protein